jgi:uncharacterized membrane protein YhaH (DUF805 family)
MQRRKFVDILRTAQYCFLTSRCRLADKLCEFFVCEGYQYSDITAYYFVIQLYTTTCFLNFKVCKSGHHRTIQINHQPHATIFQFIILTFIYSSTCFGHFPVHRQELKDFSGSLWFYFLIVVTVVLCSWSGSLQPVRPRTQHDYHHDTKVKPEAATAVIELLMMSGKRPETC